MLRHQTIAVALFLTAGATGCEIAGAPTPQKPATTKAEATPTPAPAPVATPAPATSTRVGDSQRAPVLAPDELRPMTRGGPHWGHEKPRFKLVLPPATPPDAGVPATAPSK